MLVLWQQDTYNHELKLWLSIRAVKRWQGIRTS